MLDLILGAVLAVSSQTVTGAAWITLETELDFLITKGFIGTAGHVETVCGRITAHGKARSVDGNKTTRMKQNKRRERKCKKAQGI